MKFCLVYALFLARSSQPAENLLPESGDKSIENCVRENSIKRLLKEIHKNVFCPDVHLAKSTFKNDAHYFLTLMI